MPNQGGALLFTWSRTAPRAGHAVLGYSVEGRAIDALWIGQPPESGVPTYRFFGAHHGDEWSSFEVALAMGERLVTGDGVDAEITELLDTSTVWLVPYVNPDGVVDGNRYNHNNVDLNRNYSYRWDQGEFRSGDAPFSEPETRAIRAFGLWVQPTLSVSLHSGAANYGYPWNWTVTPPSDEALYLDLADSYAALNTTPEFWTTQGAAWYETFGDTNDWSYGHHGVIDTTVEVSEIKRPHADFIKTVVDEHLDALFDQMRAPNIRGVVIDESSDRPIPASIQLLRGGSPVGAAFRTEPATGVFHRIVVEQVDELLIGAPGFVPVRRSIDDLANPVGLVPDSLDPRPILPANARITEPWRLPEPWTGRVTLSQPGHPSREIWAWSGELQIDAEELDAGAWTVSLSTGAVHARSLLVSDGSVPLATVSTDRVALSGLTAHPGTRVWALFGHARTPVSVPVLSDPFGELLLDLTDIPNNGLVDLWIISAGRHSFVSDIYDTVPTTWVTNAPPTLSSRQSCACDVKSGHLMNHFWSYLLPLSLVLYRRRQT